MLRVGLGHWPRSSSPKAAPSPPPSWNGAVGAASQCIYVAPLCHTDSHCESLRDKRHSLTKNHVYPLDTRPILACFDRQISMYLAACERTSFPCGPLLTCNQSSYISYMDISYYCCDASSGVLLVNDARAPPPPSAQRQG
eukprot:6185896-Pleurochrysis_carterae.AAC.1